MANIENMPGIQPELRKYLAGVESGLAGDVLMVIDPETTGTAATTADFERTVSLEVQNTAGDLLSWANGTFATTLSIAEVTAGDGAATIASTTLTLEGGKALVVVSCTGTWAEDDTCTLTVGNITLAGVTVTGGTSVDTIVA